MRSDFHNTWCAAAALAIGLTGAAAIAQDAETQPERPEQPRPVRIEIGASDQNQAEPDHEKSEKPDQPEKPEQPDPKKAEKKDKSKPAAETATERPAGSRGAVGTAVMPAMVRKTNIFDEAIEHAQKRTVKIFGGGIGREHGYATGLIVSEDGMILAAHGIYASTPRLRVVTADGTMHYATVMRRHDDLQVIMLKMKAETPDYFDLAQAGDVDTGDWVIGVSNVFAVAQFEEKLSANLGIVSMRSELEVKRRATDMEYEGEAIVIDAITSNPGSPGGALMTVDGKLVGMLGKNLQSKSTNTWINYAVPADMLHDFVTGKLLNNDDADEQKAKPYLGMRIFGVSRSAPAYVDRVRRNSPAEDAGFRRDDLILAIEDETIADVEGYRETFATLKPGEKVKFIVKRGTDIKTIWATPTAAEDDDD